LDNTIWDGVLLENEHVQLRAGVLDTIRALDGRGILHSIASKNSHDHAWSTIERLGLREYLLYPQISWAPKSHGIRRIAQQLNVGLDTFAFVDDNEFELDEVRRALPEVTCIHVDRLADALRDRRFEGGSTADARNRRLLYKQAIARDEALQEFGADYSKFLADSQIVLELCEYGEEFFDRVNELVQRTNQLNFSGRKYKPHEVENLLRDPAVHKFVLRCSDRYGSYGTVGFAIVSWHGPTVDVQDFMLSCRVQGKFIEQAFLRHLIERHHPAAERLKVNFRRTDRNTPALNVLTTLGFVEDQSGGMSMDLQPDSLGCDFIEMRCAGCTHVQPSAPTSETTVGFSAAPSIERTPAGR
jgi:FkbH-like protein